jgi:hypothetical protein
MSSVNGLAPQAGDTLPVLTFGEGPELVVAVHGITASAMSWPAVARRLSANWTLEHPI